MTFTTWPVNFVACCPIRLFGFAAVEFSFDFTIDTSWADPTRQTRSQRMVVRLVADEGDCD